MDIGIISSSIEEKSGGIGVYTEQLIKNLNQIDQDNRYHLIHSEYSPRDVYEYNSEIIIPRNRFLNNKPGAYMFWRYYTLSRDLKKHVLDVVHDPYELGPLSFSQPMAKVITIHDLTPLLFPRMFKRGDVLLHQLLLGRTIKNVDRIITVSEYSKQDLINHLQAPEKKIKVIHNGKDDIFQEASLEAREHICHSYSLSSPFILSVGGLHPIKNIPGLLKSYALLRGEGYHLPLVLVGKKVDSWHPIFHTLQDLGLEKEVIFTGHISQKDLAHLYSAAELFVYPCLYAGFGLPPLEAMACGTPVISSNNSSIPEVVGDAGIMVDPENHQELAHQMSLVLSDENLQKKMIKKGKKQADLFSWKTAAQKTLEVYNQAQEMHGTI